MKAIHEPTAPGAWLAATALLRKPPREIQDLVIEIATPQLLTPRDIGICREANAFLDRVYEEGLEYVANTIFPLALYDRHGWPGAAAAYRENEKRRANKGWGSYFGRLVQPRTLGVENTSHLESLVDKLKRRPGNLRNVYEASTLDALADVSIYEPERDRERGLRQPCLSHLSIRLDDGKVHITALYRSHYYLQKALGNFIGLARLQGFLAREIGVAPGSICVHSCHARLDNEKTTVGEVAALLDRMMATSDTGESSTIMSGARYLLPVA